MASLYPPPFSIMANAASPASGTSLSASSFSPLFRKSKAPKVAKPSQYYVSRVSCKATKGDPENLNSTGNKGTQEPNFEMFDRRNVHIGIGGLYGAAATLSNDLLSLAAPISPPELTNYGSPDLSSGAKPINYIVAHQFPQIADFSLPVNPQVKVRPAAHLVDATYLQNYRR